jgi:hypothetical protein
MTVSKKLQIPCSRSSTGQIHVSLCHPIVALEQQARMASSCSPETSKLFLRKAGCVTHGHEASHPIFHSGTPMAEKQIDAQSTGGFNG